MTGEVDLAAIRVRVSDWLTGRRIDNEQAWEIAHDADELLALVGAQSQRIAALEDRAYKVDQYVKEWRLRFAMECAQMDTSQSYDSDFVLNLMRGIHAVMLGHEAPSAAGPVDRG
jgi:hypothetical protein